MSRYTFGDSAVAAARLALVARVFGPASRAFLAGSAPARCSLALDLGCGPGLTTRLVAEALGADRVLGLDASRAFLRAASEVESPGLAFARADVRVVSVDPALAARMFAANLETLRQNPSVQAHYEAAELDALAAELRAGARAGADITWGLRQIVLEGGE